MLVGYGRVSSAGQSLDIQHEALAAAGCEKVFSEKVSGRSTTDREQLAMALDFVREGDTLVVTRLDRLARRTPDRANLSVSSIGCLTFDQGSARNRVSIEATVYYIFAG